jgi:protein TonB
MVNKSPLLFYALAASFFLHALFFAVSGAYGVLEEPAVKSLKPVVELFRPSLTAKTDFQKSPVLLKMVKKVKKTPGLLSAPAQVLTSQPQEMTEEEVWKKDQTKSLHQFKTETEKKLFLTYYELLSLSVKSRLSYPPEALQKEEVGAAYLVFTLDAGGHLKNLTLRKGTGSALLDQAACDALEKASPFAPFPSGLKEKTVDFYLAVYFKRYD